VPQPDIKRTEQIDAAVIAIRAVLAENVIAIYLHGSAVASGLRPQSDLDLLVIVQWPLSDGERRHLLTKLLQISARHPAPPGGPRCIEVMIFLQADISPPAFPAKAEFIFGEWLRDAYEAGEFFGNVSDPENTLVLAQARMSARPLFGPDAKDLLPDIPLTQVRTAMRDALPALIANLRGDERNVLLTLARIWRTATEGDFVSKDDAAAWAAQRMPAAEAATLTFAADAYLGRIEDDWSSTQTEAKEAAGYLRQEISALL